MRPLTEAPRERLAKIRWLATDVDDTMTHGGKFPPDVVALPVLLLANGIHTLLVTGRPAGEALGLVRYLPGITHGIAENGGVVVQADQQVRFLQPQPDRQKLLAAAAQLPCQTPLKLTADAFCRLSDVAFERGNRDDLELAAMRLRALRLGVQLVWSSVHIHLSEHLPDKGLAVLQLAQEAGIDSRHIATIGDSGNDEGLWAQGRFGLTVGTSAVLDRQANLRELPEFLTEGGGGQAWRELTAALIDARR